MENIEVDPGNSYYTSETGDLYDEEQTTLIRCSNNSDSYEIPDTVTNIGYGAFSGTSFSEIIIPNSVETIGDFAFYQSSVTSIIIPDTITSIGHMAFYSCGVTEIAIPGNVTYIGAEAFEGCYNLTTVTIMDGVQNISNWMFSCCNNLTEVTIPSSVQNIGEGAFCMCMNLSTVLIPEGVVSIGALAFADSVEEITVPASVTYIGEYALGFTTNPVSQVVDNVTYGSSNSAYSVCFAVTLADENSEQYYPIPGFTITGYSGTAAERYANENGFFFVPLRDKPTPDQPAPVDPCADGHTWDDGVVTKAPTALEPGIITYTCTVCGETKTEAIPANGVPFTDLDAARFYYTPVLWAVDNGVTTGMTPTLFCPMIDCTRAQAVTFLWRAMGEPEPTITSCDFVDVKEGTFYYKAMLWAVEEGITIGMDSTHFAPDAQVTRSQFVTLLWRAEGKPEPETSVSPFVDVVKSENRFYYKAVLWAAENGITTGMDATHFEPEGAMTRGQAVTFLYRDLAENQE